MESVFIFNGKEAATIGGEKCGDGKEDCFHGDTEEYNEGYNEEQENCTLNTDLIKNESFPIHNYTEN